MWRNVRLEINYNASTVATLYPLQTQSKCLESSVLGKVNETDFLIRIVKEAKKTT
jgi:hypothetical protein